MGRIDSNVSWPSWLHTISGSMLSLNPRLFEILGGNGIRESSRNWSVLRGP